MRRAALAILWLFLLFALGPGAAQALYRWIDDNGDVHIAGRLEDIPERYRARATLVSQPGPPSERSCAGLPGEPKGGGRVVFSLEQQHMLVNVCVNGRGPIRLIVDTGAGRTFVSPRFLEELGYDLKKAPDTVVAGIGGAAAAKRVRVRTVQVGGAKLGPMEVVAYELGFRGADGLLGQDFIAKFITDIDNARGILTLTPR